MPRASIADFLSRPRPNQPLLLLVATLSVACGRPAANSGGETRVSDSAGITIVENETDLSDLPRWSLDTKNVVVMGNDSVGPGSFQELEGARLLADGSILLIEGRPPEVRLFDARGKFVRVVAREGGGPGELRCAGRPHFIAADTIAVLDQCLRRVLFFDGKANVTGTEYLPRGSLYPAALTFDFDAERVLSRTAMVTTLHSPDFCDAPRCRNPIAVVRFSSGKQGADTLFMTEGNDTRGQGREIMLGATTTLSLGPRGFLVANGARAEIAVRSLTGQLVRLIRWRPTASRYTDGDLAAFRAHDSATHAFSGPSAIASWQAQLSSLEFAKEAPQLTNVTKGDNGEIWLQRDFRKWAGDLPYVVFDSSGRAVAQLMVPRGSWPIQFGPDFVLAWHENNDQERTIRRYRLAR